MHVTTEFTLILRNDKKKYIRSCSSNAYCGITLLLIFFNFEFCNLPLQLYVANFDFFVSELKKLFNNI